MKRFWLCLFTVCIGTGLILGGFASVFAQEKEKAVFTLDEIIVSAERVEANAQDTPIAVTAFDSTMLDAQGIDHIFDLQMRMPSTTITGNKVYIRGIGTEQNNLGIDPGVGIYVDGFYSSTGGGWLGDSFDVERFEFVRGPQSTLLGRNTIGGAILITHKKPTEEFEGQIKWKSLYIGETLGWGAYLAVSGPLTKNKKLLGRIRARSWRDWFWGGYGENQYDGVEYGGFNGSDIDLHMTYKPTDKLKVWL